jgi:hypothetical protein
LLGKWHVNQETIPESIGGVYYFIRWDKGDEFPKYCRKIGMGPQERGGRRGRAERPSWVGGTRKEREEVIPEHRWGFFYSLG